VGFQLDPQNPIDQDVAANFQEMAGATQEQLLLITAADNLRVVHDGRNAAPQSIDAPNLLTVTGTGLCTPTAVDDGLFATGDPAHVQVAGPAVGVPVDVPKVGISFYSGTSFAAPQVTALAAILKSLDPALTPAQIKDLIVLSGGVAQDSSGGMYTRLNLYLVLAQYLFEHPPTGRVRDILGAAPYGEGLIDAGIAVARLCDHRLEVDIEGDGMRIVSFDEIFRLGEGFDFQLNNPAATVLVQVPLPDGALLGMATAPVVLDSLPATLPVNYFHFAEGADVCDPIGASQGVGEVRIDRCWIDEMDPISGVEPYVVTLDGEYVTGIDMMVEPCVNPLHVVTKSVQGRIRLPFLNMYWYGAGDELKRICDLGRKPDE
jgi:hypothetical protein